MKACRDLTGEVFGWLTVLERAGTGEKYKTALWRCRCHCGVEKAIVRGSLINGLTRSCGCLRRDAALERAAKRPKVERPAPVPKAPRVRAPKADLAGQTFGRLRVLSFAKFVGKNAQWRCRCECGRLKNIRGDNIKSGSVISCGCFRGQSITIDISGTKIGFVQIIRALERQKRKGTLWLCKCECGNTFSALGSALKDSGETASCGCHKAAVARQTGKLQAKHGQATNFERPVEYTAWGTARYRNKIVAPEFDDFEQFLAIVGRRPSDEHRLVIVDKAIGFVPGNVEWRHFPKKTVVAVPEPFRSATPRVLPWMVGRSGS